VGDGLRVCSKCKQSKPADAFYSDLRRSQCRQCNRDYLASRRREKAEFIRDYKLKHPCVDCGYLNPEFTETLEFDHLPGQAKIAAPSDMTIRFTIEQIAAELERCEVVCANCHRIRTLSEIAANGSPSTGWDLRIGADPSKMFRRGRRSSRVNEASDDDLRQCTKCKEYKPARSAFYNSPKKQQCRACAAEWIREYKRERVEFINAHKLSMGCHDCGLKIPEFPGVLELDHRPGETKLMTPSSLTLRASMEQIVEELAKCDVVCARCHRIRTVKRIRATGSATAGWDLRLGAGPSIDGRRGRRRAQVAGSSPTVEGGESDALDLK
jgi:hypothetical protein